MVDIVQTSKEGNPGIKINVSFLPSEIGSTDLANTVCIVLDIFRATSSIVTAVANGCEAIFPVLSVEEAHNLAQQKGQCLLAGERQSIKIDGFDLGNSPYDFSRDVVIGRQIVMTTTNGTAAIRATEGACRTLIGSFLNAEAVCQQARQSSNDILIVCAGTECRFSLEDALCAGLLVELLSRGETQAELTDAAYAALFMYKQTHGSLAAAAGSSRNGRRLNALGRGCDIEYCLRTNVLGVVPEYKEGRICGI